MQFFLCSGVSGFKSRSVNMAVNITLKPISGWIMRLCLPKHPKPAAYAACLKETYPEGRCVFLSILTGPAEGQSLHVF